VVEEANLARQIFTLRKALGDGGDDGASIRTVPRRGYEFVADVAGDVREARPPGARSP
jgi:DNA-binding winged helix-turn-helix (wHTH) protein